MTTPDQNSPPTTEGEGSGTPAAAPVAERQIKVPDGVLRGPELQKAEAALYAAIHPVEVRLASVDVRLPWEAIQILSEIERDLAALAASYARCARGLVYAPFDFGFKAGMQWNRTQFLLAANTTSASIRADALHRHWRDVESAIERKQSRAYAMLGMYLGCLSLVLAVWALLR